MLEGRIKFSKKEGNDCLLHALMATADRDMASSGGDKRCRLPVKRKTADDDGTGTAGGRLRLSSLAIFTMILCCPRLAFAVQSEDQSAFCA